ncbi:MAG: hypothetical protein KIS86_17390 [Devosia sp.]|nr:hypothetical protein [Devosia sp.]
MDAIPNSIHEGMKVYDRARHEIGTVETFRISDEDPTIPGPESVGVSPALDDERRGLSAVLADMFSPDDGLPREMQEKALREGYIRLDAKGLFASDRYIFPEHIDHVEADGIVLKVEKDDLLRA